MICQYTAFLVHSLKVTFIKNYLEVISQIHKEFGLTNSLIDNWPLKSLLLGIKRVKGGNVAQKLPITPNVLLGIYSKLNMSQFQCLLLGYMLGGVFWYVQDILLATNF